MPVRRVQRREVVVRVLDLGPVEDLVAEPDEDVLDLAADLGDQVEVAARDGVTGEGDVDLLLGERAVELAGAKLFARPGRSLLRFSSARSSTESSFAVRSASVSLLRRPRYATRASSSSCSVAAPTIAARASAR